MKRMLLSFCLIILALTAANIFAADLPIKQFQAGDVISAADVNNNFKALAEAVQQLQKQGTELQKQVAELQKQNKALIEENRALKNSLAKTQTKTAEPEKQASTVASTTSSSKTPKYRLRSKAKTVSGADAWTVFGLDAKWRPLKYIENDFEMQGDVVIDHATGLMWQKADSTQRMNYTQVQEYINQLNQSRFSGYADWRLPTVDELLSLVESETQPNGRRINSIFIITSKDGYCSADLDEFNTDWKVTFDDRENVALRKSNYYVRAVRSLQP